VPIEAIVANFKALSLREHIVELLTKAILEGEIKPGERLNESALARQLRVSRAPIREALQQLEEQGLVVNQPRRGMFVVHLAAGDLQKINSLRLVLEAEALRLCRERATPALLNQLEAMARTMEQTQSANAIEATRLDLAFHRQLWQASGNEYLERTLYSLTAPLFAFAVLTKPEATKARMILDSHRPLVEYVAGLTTQDAQQVIAAHIQLRWDKPDQYASAELKKMSRGDGYTFSGTT
jgi:DNA-binding GntR family transcriptional regulator